MKYKLVLFGLILIASSFSIDFFYYYKLDGIIHIVCGVIGGIGSLIVGIGAAYILQLHKIRHQETSSGAYMLAAVIPVVGFVYGFFSVSNHAEIRAHKLLAAGPSESVQLKVLRVDELWWEAQPHGVVSHENIEWRFTSGKKKLVKIGDEIKFVYLKSEPGILKRD